MVFPLSSLSKSKCSANSDSGLKYMVFFLAISTCQAALQILGSQYNQDTTFNELCSSSLCDFNILCGSISNAKLYLYAKSLN